MTEIIDYGRFADRLAAPRPRWDLLREFQDEWGYTVPAGVDPWPKWSESEHHAYVRALHEYWLARAELDLILSGRMGSFQPFETSSDSTSSPAASSREGH